MRMKGFVMTMDAMFAIAIASAAAFAIISMLSAGIAQLNAQQIVIAGSDILSVMQHNRTFSGYIGASDSFVDSDILSKLGALPAQYCGNMTVTIYDAGNFANSRQYNAATCGSGSDDIYKAKRMFADYGSRKFGIAELELWLK